MLKPANAIKAICLLGLCLDAWAINVRTTVPSVNHEGSYEIVGHFTLDLDSNEFAQASPANPIYIRFGLQHSNGWSKTLVDLRMGAPDIVNAAINLAIHPGSDFMLNPAIPESAVQLVRLIAGERHGWIKVTFTSSEWVFDGVGNTSPSPSRKVSINVGLRGPNSVHPDGSTSSGGNEWSDTGQLANTQLCADYRNTPEFGVGDLEIVDFLSLDATTTGVEDGDFVLLGGNVGIGFSNDVIIARGANYIPCFEYHFQPDSFEGPPHEVGLSRFNLVALREYRGDLPAVYFTNSSDFAWEPSSRLLLTNPYFDPEPYVRGQSYPRQYDPPVPPTHLKDGPVQIKVGGSGTWEVRPIYLNGVLMGYEFLLTQGVWAINERLDITGLEIMADEYFKSLTLNATAFFINQEVTEGILYRLGPLRRLTAELSDLGSDGFRHAIPFTAYDNTSWSYKTHLTNPHETEATYTALFYNRHGVLLRIIGMETLDANATVTLSIRELYGELADRVLAWIEILADKPLAAVGVIEDQNQKVLDVFPSITRFQDVLFGTHIPADSVSWNAKAYVLSSDPRKDTAFFLKLPGDEETLVKSIIIPGGTAVLSDPDFVGTQGRSPWLELLASEPTGAGLMIFSRRDDQSQLAGVAMNEVPAKKWLFAHVGDPNGQWWNGVALLNATAEQTEVTLKGFDSARNLLVTRELTIAPETKVVDLLTNLLPYAGATPLARLEIESERDLVSFLLLGQQNRSLLTTIPGNPPVGRDFVLPYLPRRLGDWVGLALVNDGAFEVEAELTPFLEDGTAGLPVVVAIQPNRKTLLMVGDLFPSGAYTHLKLESDQPIQAFALTGNAANSQLATLQFQPVVSN